MDLHLEPEPFGKLGEGSRVLALVRPFAQFLADEDFVVYQRKESLGIARDGGEIAAVRPHIDPFAVQPAAALVHAQHSEQVVERQRRPSSLCQEGADVGPLALVPHRFEPQTTVSAELAP